MKYLSCWCNCLFWNSEFLSFQYFHVTKANSRLSWTQYSICFNNLNYLMRFSCSFQCHLNQKHSLFQIFYHLLSCCEFRYFKFIECYDFEYSQRELHEMSYHQSVVEVIYGRASWSCWLFYCLNEGSLSSWLLWCTLRLALSYNSLFLASCWIDCFYVVQILLISVFCIFQTFVNLFG